MIFEAVTPRLERLCRATMEIAAPLVIGDTPPGLRHIVPISGGRVEGVRLRCGPPDVLARIGGGEALDPATYYFRTTPRFETGAPAHAWLNDVIAVGSAVRRSDAVILDFYVVTEPAEHRSGGRGYRITRPARPTIADGMVIPSAEAVFRLTASSNRVGRSTGRSAGLAPFRILST